MAVAVALAWVAHDAGHAYDESVTPNTHCLAGMAVDDDETCIWLLGAAGWPWPELAVAHNHC